VTVSRRYQIAKLELAPGDILVMKIPMRDFTPERLERLSAEVRRGSWDRRSKS
jgi:hypothetical protein